MLKAFIRVLSIAGGIALLISLPSIAQDPEKLRQVVETLEALKNEPVLEDPHAILAWVDLPRSIPVGATVTLKISIENGRPAEIFRLSSIDIADDFLNGFKLVRILPDPRQQDHGMGTLSLEFPIDIPAGATRDIEIILVAKKIGVYIGDVDIIEGERFLTRAAQARVKE